MSMNNSSNSAHHSALSYWTTLSRQRSSVSTGLDGERPTPCRKRTYDTITACAQLFRTHALSVVTCTGPTVCSTLSQQSIPVATWALCFYRELKVFVATETLYRDREPEFSVTTEKPKWAIAHCFRSSLPLQFFSCIS